MEIEIQSVLSLLSTNIPLQALASKIWIWKIMVYEKAKTASPASKIVRKQRERRINVIRTLLEWIAKGAASSNSVNNDCPT
jgi:hypothetical protein